MKRIIQLLLLILVMGAASSVWGQTTLTITGTVKDPTGIAYAGGTGTVTLNPTNVRWTVGGSPITNQFVVLTLSPTGAFSVQLTNTSVIDQQNLGPQWAFSFTSAPRWNYSNPSQSTQQTYSFTMTPLSLTSSQDISGQIQAQATALPVGNGIGYSKNAVYASSNCNGAPNCYPVNANTHWVSDSVVTSGSNIVTATDGNFFSNAKVGQIVWAVHGNLNLGNGVLDLSETTILSVDSATQIHTTATASASGNPDTLVWGTLDTPAHGNCSTGVDNLKTAWNAALNQNVPLWLPAGGGNVSTSGSGGIMVECSELQSPITTGNATYTGAPSLIGEGGESYIMATPLFDFTSVPGGYGALASIAPSTASVPNVGIMRDMAFMCGGYNTWGTGQNIPILFTNRVIMNNVTGWGCGAGGSTIFGFYNTGTSTIMAGMFYNFGAAAACVVSNGGQNSSTMFTGTGYCSGPIGLSITAGSWVASYGTFYQAFGSTAAVNLAGNNITFNSYGDVLDAESNNSSIALKLTGTGDKAFLSGTQLYTTTIVPTFGLAYVTSGSTLSLADTSFFGTTGAAISGSGLGGLVYDQGNNTYTAALTICASSACTPIGSGSANQTLLTGAKLVLSANWGTGAVVSVPLGANSPITFTITNGSAAVGAAPTITYTFPTPYWIAPLWCTATDASGTNPIGTFTAGVPTTTSVVFTFSLTPTINDTELMQVTCNAIQ